MRRSCRRASLRWRASQSRAAPALPALQGLLAHAEPDIRWGALRAIAAIGPAAGGAVADVEPLLREESAAIRLAAADAMQRIHPPAPLSEERFAATVGWLEQHVPDLMREQRVPGVSIAIMQRGKVAWSRGFGVSDARSGKAVTTETVFEACSMSKPVLALVAMQLVQERLPRPRPATGGLPRARLPA